MIKALLALLFFLEFAAQASYAQSSEQRASLQAVGAAIGWSRGCTGVEVSDIGIAAALTRSGIAPNLFKAKTHYQVVEDAAIKARNDSAGLGNRERCMAAVAKFGSRGSTYPDLVTPVLDASEGTASTRQISAFDFLVDGQSLVGSTVTISDCTLHYARSNFMMCAVLRKGQNLGEIILDGDTMDRASFRAALERCSDVLPTRSCRLKSVTGLVRKNAMGDLRIDRAILDWKRG